MATLIDFIQYEENNALAFYENNMYRLENYLVLDIYKAEIHKKGTVAYIEEKCDLVKLKTNSKVNWIQSRPSKITNIYGMQIILRKFVGNTRNIPYKLWIYELKYKNIYEGTLLRTENGE